MARALPLPHPLWAALLVGVAFLASAAAPLWTYGLTLAVFGGAHVLTELRFVEARFGERLLGRTAAALGVLLLAVVGLRIAKALHLWRGVEAVRVELLVVLALGLVALPTLWRAGAGRLLVGGAALAALAWGLLHHPVWTILALACLHNWTPVAFLAEALPGPARRRGLLLTALVFGLLPLLLALGLPQLLFAGGWPELQALGTGPLSRNLGAYLPSAWHDRPWAAQAFSALVFAQCMHYAVVIGVLPRLAGAGRGGPLGLSRIPGRTFALAVVALSAVGLVGYVVDFHVARSWYGVAAAVHAWVELPVLLMALGGPAGGDSGGLTAVRGP